MKQPIWTAVRDLEEVFEDIRIVDLDSAKTTWSRVHTSMRTVYLRLSREPDFAWSRFFHEERASRINARRHGLWIEDEYIVIDCMLDEVQTHQLPDIEKSIRFANEQSRVLREQRRVERQSSTQAVADEREQLAELRGEIRRRADAPSATVAPVVAPVPEPPAPEPEPPASGDADLDARLAELRAQFRRARTSQKPETDRGDD